MKPPPRHTRSGSTLRAPLPVQFGPAAIAQVKVALGCRSYKAKAALARRSLQAKAATRHTPAVVTANVACPALQSEALDCPYHYLIPGEQKSKDEEKVNRYTRKLKFR